MSAAADQPAVLEPEPAVTPPAAKRTGAGALVRRVAVWVGTVLGAAVVLFTLMAPDRLTQFSAGAFLRIPIEGLLLVALFLAVRGRARSLVLGGAGVGLGLLIVIRLFNLGFYTALSRPFDPVLDWVLLRPAFELVESSLGKAAALGATIVLGIVVLSVPVVMTLALRRLGRLAVRHEQATARGTAVLAGVWALCAVLNVQIADGVPVASDGAVGAIGVQVGLVRRDIDDGAKFGRQSQIDAFRDVPGSQLLTSLRGKDVLLTFVESYGRDAVSNPQYAPQVNATLDEGTRRLAAAGFSARSAFLTSPITGGGSWMAHETLLSGLWVDNNQRSATLLAGDRFTMNAAFRRAGWRVAGIMPANDRDWPEGKFFQYHELYDSRNMGYKGPKFSYVPVPDQFTLAAFQRLERAPGHQPVFAEIPLVSSHAPWTPIPQMLGWDEIGDGTVYSTMSTAGDPPDVAWRTSEKIRTAYRNSIVYSLSSLISYVETYGDDNLVVVFLGDHQPSPVIVGDTASHDVPITIVARDPKVLDKISGWGWQDGLRPGDGAPVWRMDQFRDKFLTAYR
ncbi:sulfatase-like hydrolase/transferase [Dactylosporangium sp. CA-233914]|uniref:sulfatase-like hydrolase/transferase n=1 Tax=Dactylosporangium sp. CA-233914 TaxID=3239934 RepID=UPI003D8FDA57